ncbi:MAG: hypothetical protein RPU39_00175 [Candidatus Sedimenticola sp. (ex Thyasira tokunagai)]
MKFKKKVLVAKIEGTYGTDAAPTGAANAILVSNLDISPMEGSTVGRDLVRPTLGNDLQIHVGTHVKLECDVEVAGAGAAGTAPAYGPLLRICGMAQTINAGDVQYDPVSGGEESGTLYFLLDGQQHALVGARGAFSLKADPGSIPKFHFSMTGLWVDPETVADVVPDWSAFQTPLAVTNDNTPTFGLHGISPNMLGFTFEQNNQVVYRNVVGEESVQITDRAPSGQVTIEAPTLDTKNFFTTAKANTTGALQLVHGVTAGNIVQFDADQVQLLQPKYGDSDGVATLQMGLSVIPTSAGDDDFKITVK